MFNYLKKPKAVLTILYITVLIVFDAYLALRVNAWYGVFYDALQNKDYETFLQSFISLGELSLDIHTWGFGILATLLITIYAHIGLVSNKLQFDWRTNLSKDLAYKLTCSPSVKVEGASQRIVEDSKKLAWMFTGLFKNFIKSLAVLFFFIPVLWELSSGFDVEGYLVYVSIASSLIGLGISVIVGRKLKGLEYNNQVIEAELRKEVVLGEDKPMESHLVSDILRRLKTSYYSLYGEYKWYALWEQSYFQISVVIPFIASAEQFFFGVMTLGILMQVGNAFGKCHRAFSWFIDRWSMIAEVRSVMQRIDEFNKEYPKMKSLKEQQEEEDLTKG